MAVAETTSAPKSQVASLDAKPARSLWSDAWRRLTRNKGAMLGSCIIIIFALVALAAPLLSPHNPLTQNAANKFLPPAWVVNENNPARSGRPEHLLGTDNLGRDVFSQLLYGARISMLVGVVPTSIILLVGISVGMIAGFFGGKIDNALMRFTDIVYSFPDLLFFIIMVTALRDTFIGKLMGGLILLFIALALVGWVGIARLVRGQVLSLKEKEFVQAAEMVGSSKWRIMTRHLFPNTLAPIIVATAFAIPGAILTEATLGYLGLGIRPATDPAAPFPTSWGAMILDGRVAMNAQEWMLLAPTLCVALILLSFTFLGDGLRDALDPRLQQ